MPKQTVITANCVADELVMTGTILRISRFLNQLICIEDLPDTSVADETAMIATIFPIAGFKDQLI